MRNSSYQKLFLGVVVLLVLAAGGPASAASTSVSQSITPGLLTLTSQAAATLPSATVDAVHNHASTGPLGAINATDSRGSGAGWSLTATATDFTSIGQPAVVSNPSGAAISSGGTLAGGVSGTYTVSIIHSGVPGIAQYSVSGMETQGPTNVSYGDIPLGTHGVTINFAGPTYLTGDQWTITVASIPVGDLTITPSSVNAMVGSYTGVTAGAVHTFSSSSDSATVMAASSGNGLGWYINTPTLSLDIPPATRSGNYTATITETLN